MALSNHKEIILATLHAASHAELLDEDTAWREIEQTVAEAIADDDSEQRSRIDRYIRALSRIYANQIGTPQCFDGSPITRFERFVHAIPPPDGLTITRDLVKAAIRRLDAHPVFVAVYPEPQGPATKH
jgi:hypothetical protein